jgi:hypothetical protein
LYLKILVFRILPGKACKINPENSDFSVGNFLTANKKAASCQEAAQ